MEPKKKSNLDYILYVVALILVMYFAVQGAAVWKEAVELSVSGALESGKEYGAFFELLPIYLAEKPLFFEINVYTETWCLWGGLGWLLVVASIETAKRNYIHGKEYGTARWGTINDIKDLFAENIKKDELKSLKKMESSWGRKKLQKKKFAEVQASVNRLYKKREDDLEAEIKAAKMEKEYDAEEFKKRKAQLAEEKSQDLENYKRDAWKPYRFEAELKERLNRIQEGVGSGLLTEEEGESEKAQAWDEYNKKLKAYLNNPAKVKEIEKKYAWADMLFTQEHRISFYNYKVNQNTLIIGGSGSGKSRGFCLPNLLQANADHGFSYIVTDPKGELLEKTGKFFKSQGYKIRVLNLDNKQESDCYNPFFYIHPFRAGYEERVLQLIETIVANTDGGKEANSSDPFWPKAERLFLQSIFFFVVDAFPLAEQNMETAMDLIAMLELAEDEDNMDSDLDLFVESFREWYKEKMKPYYKEGEEIPDHIGVRLYHEFRSKASGKTAKSIVISAVARLTPFTAPEIKRITNHDCMQLDRVGEEKTIIFVVVSPVDSTFNFVAGCLFTQLFQELQYCASQVHKHDGQRLPVPCRFILDEYANTCRIPNMLKILAYARSFGVGIAIILQSLEQAKEIHEKDWGVMVDNCNTLLYLGSVTHGDTLDYISKLLGKGTFDKRTTGRTKGKSGSSSQNFDVVGRELLDSAEIRKLPKSKCLLVVGGRPPFYADKYEYKSHPNYAFTSDANKANSYEHRPLTEKQILEIEKSYVQKIEEEQEKERAKREKRAGQEIQSEIKVAEPSLVDDLNNFVMREPDIELLKRLTSSLSSFEIIPDEVLCPDEDDSVEAAREKWLQEDLQEAREKKNALLEAFGNSLAELSIPDNSKPDTQRNLVTVRFTDDPKEIALHMGRLIRDGLAENGELPFEPIPDEILNADDEERGEAVAESYLSMLEEDEQREQVMEELNELDETESAMKSLLSDLSDLVELVQSAQPGSE